MEHSNIDNISNNTMNRIMNEINIFKHSIADLRPYHNQLLIKARVTGKSRIRPYNGGRWFNMTLMDASGEIRATAFNYQCDKFHNIFEVNNVYVFSKGWIRPAYKMYSEVNNDYEMIITDETMILVCDAKDTDDIPEINFDLIPISQVPNIESNAVLDTIGICTEVGDLVSGFSNKTNKEFKKRELTLVDTSNAAVTLTLWDDDAVHFAGHVKTVILVKGSRVNEFMGGKSLSMGGGSILKINPDIPEAHKLRGWFDNGGGDNVNIMVSARADRGSYILEWMSLKDAYIRGLGSGVKPDYFQCKAVVRYIKQEIPFYIACPQWNCNKKVVDVGNGQYYCERCNATYPNFKYHLLITVCIADRTSNQLVKCFGMVAEQLLRHTTQEIVEAAETKLQKIFSDVNYSCYIFKLSCKNSFYMGALKNNLTIQSVSPINCKEYNKRTSFSEV